jgi:hypothetical protein
MVEVQVIGSFFTCWTVYTLKPGFIHAGNLFSSWLSKSKDEMLFVTTLPEPNTRLFAPLMVFYSP